jgi:DNA repair exonuclease SbcCD ATPase subunit
MRISGLRLRNFVCYRGEHELKLQPLAYAVVARTVDDPRRSNWSGKSSLLESVLFALYGEHRWPTEDSWITRGEEDGGVEVDFDNGLTVERTRTRGGSTKLLAKCVGLTKGNAGDAKGDEAQQIIDEAVGLDKQDFKAICYVEQKRMARFVTARPAERMDTIVGWLRLEKLDACSDKQTAELNRLMDLITKDQQRLAANRFAADELVKQHGTKPLPELRDQQARLATSYESDVARLEEDAERVRLWRADENASTSYKAIVEEGIKLKAWLVAVDVPTLNGQRADAAESEKDAADAYNVARRDLTQKEALVRGQFDGKCPIAGMQCPAKDDINAGLTRNTKLHQDAKAKAERAFLASGKAQSEKASLDKRCREAEAAVTKLETLRQQAMRMREAANRFAAGCNVTDVETLTTRLANARDRLADARAQVKVIDAAIVRVSQLNEESAKLSKSIEALQREADTAREAHLVFRRSRQRIAERALSSIEDGANDLLRTSGIDLSVQARWQREGNGLADNCDTCGAAFGRSLKVKVCPRCAEPRGPKMVNKLDLVLSSVSGAAEDLAGGAFQLSASAWLRKVRACAWSVALIDEPFGALDEANREAFATHLATMLSGQYGMEQSLIVSHDPKTVACLPGRIEIVCEGGFSRPAVLA